MTDSEAAVLQKVLAEIGQLRDQVEQANKRTARIESLLVSSEDPEKGAVFRIKELETFRDQQREKDRTRFWVLMTATVSAVGSLLAAIWGHLLGGGA